MEDEINFPGFDGAMKRELDVGLHITDAVQVLFVVLWETQIAQILSDSIKNPQPNTPARKRLSPCSLRPARAYDGKELYFPRIHRILSTMSLSFGSVEEKIQTLPPDLRAEAIYYIDELVKRSKKRTFKPFRCAAEGTLEELGARYSSVDLQHKAMEWRGA